ncbi:MAG: nucleotidyl transferase AbiEii/AbiGii toxin family protein [Candidatus Omnitrophica bacterium]|nr:nucleotidyl transferase AbiEii/AbiGii toxin family protein [Candidatus Omnitrophota bacterium]
MYNFLQQREVFHLEFLRWFSRRVKADIFALKGGVNLRFFYKSLRYSEDMDLDIGGVRLDIVKDIVMETIVNASFQGHLKTFGIDAVIPPDITKAKQTFTTQRFKIHLITSAGEDLFTKVEFSRRGLKKGIEFGSVSNTLLRDYKLAPLLVPHYDVRSAILQKIEAIALRPSLQARDIFDLYILSSQCKDMKIGPHSRVIGGNLVKAHERIFDVSFEQFRDTVVSYLASDDQALYDRQAYWDEIKLRAADFIDELGKPDA